MNIDLYVSSRYSFNNYFLTSHTFEPILQTLFIGNSVHKQTQKGFDVIIFQAFLNNITLQQTGNVWSNKLKHH